MLHEITRLRQSNRRQTKRCFTCRNMDLFIWSYKSVPLRFQLAYNKTDEEKMISWDINRGFSHHLVDTGETRPDHHKRTLLLASYEQNNMRQLAHDFLSACENIDTDISDFIFARLMELPANPARHSANHINRNFLG